MDTEPKILIINLWDSRCGVCGKSCSYSSKTHDVILGYGDENGSEGCGVKWTHVSSDYTNMSKSLTRARPDLEQINVFTIG